MRHVMSRHVEYEASRETHAWKARTALRRLAWLGTALLIVSLPSIVLMAREVATNARANSQYSLILPHDPSYQSELGGHEIAWSALDGYGNVSVNGRELRAPDLARAGRTALPEPPKSSVLNLWDRDSGTKTLTVTQRFPATPRDVYRITMFHEDARITEEVFGAEERAEPVYRAMLIRFVTPFDLGYHSRVLGGWPSALWFVYPAGTTIVGVLLIVVWIVAGRFLVRSEESGSPV